MRKVSLFIAMSLDGYIADSRGGVNWLEGYEDGGASVVGQLVAEDLIYERRAEKKIG